MNYEFEKVSTVLVFLTSKKSREIAQKYVKTTEQIAFFQ